MSIPKKQLWNFNFLAKEITKSVSTFFEREEDEDISEFQNFLQEVEEEVFKKIEKLVTNGKIALQIPQELPMTRPGDVQQIDREVAASVEKRADMKNAIISGNKDHLQSVRAASLSRMLENRASTLDRVHTRNKDHA